VEQKDCGQHLRIKINLNALARAGVCLARFIDNGYQYAWAAQNKLNRKLTIGRELTWHCWQFICHLILDVNETRGRSKMPPMSARTLLDIIPIFYLYQRQKGVRAIPGFS
jgi:hypothetical protein